MSGVRVVDAGGHRALDAPALLRLLPGVREDADRARQDEQAASQRRRETELAVDHRGRAVELHRDALACAALERCLDEAADARETPFDDVARGLDERQQAHRARIGAVEAMTETGNDPAVRGD